MRRRSRLLCQAMALSQTRLVFGVYGHAPSPGHQRGKYILFAIEQERAGRGAEKRLYARDARRLFQRTQRSDILRRRADVKGVIAMHASIRTRELVLESEPRRCRRIRIRHFKHRRHATQDGGAAAAFQIFLVFVTGLAEMHLRIDHARKNMKPTRVENLYRGVGKRADRSDSAAADSDVRFPDSVRRSDDSAPDKQIEHLSGRLP